MTASEFNDDMLEFIKNSPTQFHAVAALKKDLEQSGFIRLNESEAWSINKKTGYYIIRNDSSIIAFYTGNADFEQTGIKMVGTHSDSPGLKVKPAPELSVRNFLQLGVEIYGGPILDTWFDRDLSLAGRISFIHQNKAVSKLIDFKEPFAIIPNLAIHLNRDINNGRTILKQKELPPVISMGDKSIFYKKIRELSGPVSDQTEIEYDLFFYHVQPPAKLGLNKEFITGSRLDNLISCYAGVRALMQTEKETPALFVSMDNEETGSNSYAGADGNFLKSVLKRITRTYENYAQCMSRSIMISADNAHSVHPSHTEKHDDTNSPVINGGPVIKYNASGKYATTSRTAAHIRHLAACGNIPLQNFVSRTDMPCGSTIGPIISAALGIETIDIGVPMLAMHSLRETAGSEDAFLLLKLLEQFYNSNVIS